jgi:hypothetical protein
MLPLLLLLPLFCAYTIGRPHMDRRIMKYFGLLTKALDNELQPPLDPGPRIRFTLLGDYVSKKNKRKVMFFVCVGVPETSTQLYEIGYTLPVPAYSSMYETDEDPLPSDGPTFFKVAVAPGAVRAKMAATAARFEFLPWSSEIARLKAMGAELGPYVKENPDDKKKKGVLTAVRRALEYWGAVRSPTHDAFERAGISMMSSSSSASSSASSSSGSSGSSVPRAMTRSSRGSSSRRSYASAKSYHTRYSTPRTTDPKPRRNSDPRRRKTKKSRN